MSPSTESSISCALAFAFNERKRARSSAVVWRYYWASRAWIAARGRVLLQCIAVTTTCQSAARSSDLTTAMRMLWRVAMGFRGAPHSPPRAVRALRPPRGQRWHRSHHHVAANDLARVRAAHVGSSCSSRVSPAPRRALSSSSGNRTRSRTEIIESRARRV